MGPIWRTIKLQPVWSKRQVSIWFRGSMYLFAFGNGLHGYIGSFGPAKGFDLDAEATKKEET